MATDGLWDVTNNVQTMDIVSKSLGHFSPNASLEEFKYRYVSAAQDLVMQSRGKLSGNNWRTSDNRAATVDDISAFVIPLFEYKAEYLKRQENLAKLDETAAAAAGAKSSNEDEAAAIAYLAGLADVVAGDVYATEAEPW